MGKLFKGISAFTLAIFFLVYAPQNYLFAQDEWAGGEAPVARRELTPEQNRINQEINTSSLAELAALARSLGLSEAGTSADLARRIRAHYQIPDFVESQPDARRNIRVESARHSRSFVINEVNEEYLRLVGDVRITLTEGDATHTISAWEVLFNTTRNIITASGNVVYIRREGDRTETFRGDSITVDIDNWSSVFLGGVSERAMQGEGTTYLFSGKVISRDDEDVTILQRARISNAGNEESFWSLTASRVWLLPGSDFAILNAVLRVGEIPVLYIQFFYFPADEIVFRPVIGSRQREGNFIQTTSYIWGRPRATGGAQSSLTRILGSTGDMERRREGMFLRSTGRPAVDIDTRRLVVMADFYANLGAYIGADFTLPARGVFGETEFSTGIAFSRTVARGPGGSHTPFLSRTLRPDGSYLYTANNPDGTVDWNRSSLFSINVPFRYRFRGRGSLRGRAGNFTWNVPLFSDPFIESDFLNRATEMDWINMIQRGAQALEADFVGQGALGSYLWTFSGNFNFRFPTLAPFITNISISGITSNVSFTSVSGVDAFPVNDIRRSYSPLRQFFAPNTALLYQISGSISGNPLNIGGRTAPRPAAVPTEEERPDPLRNIGVPRSPFPVREEPPEPPRRDPADTLVPPPLRQTFALPRAGNFNLTWDYSFSPSSSSNLNFDTRRWRQFDDVNWGDIASITTQFAGSGSTQLNFRHTSGFFSTSFQLSGSGAWHQFTYLNEEATEFLTPQGDPNPDRVASERERLFRNSHFSSSYSLTASVRPFMFSNVFGASTISYSLGGLAVRSNFIGTGHEPEWEWIYGDAWNSDNINTHSFSSTISASIMDTTQSVSITASLPPRDASLSFSGNFRFWIAGITARWGIRNPGEPDDRHFEDFSANANLNFGTFASFSQGLTLNVEDRILRNFSSTLRLPVWGTTISYTAQRGHGFNWDGTAWIANERIDENFILRPNNFSVNFARTFNARDLFGGRVNFTANTSSGITFDLQRYTNSSLTFTLGGTLRITDFLNLTMSVNSRNNVIYRYFRNWFFFSDIDIDVGEEGARHLNFFLDLIDSFRFGDDAARQRSGFKMNSFRLAATHNLGDWDATLGWTMSPWRPNNRSPFEMNNEVTFAVRWIPITEFHTDISYNRRRGDNQWLIQGLGTN